MPVSCSGCLRLIEQQARPRIFRPLAIHSTSRPPAYCGEHNGLQGHVNLGLPAPGLSPVSSSCWGEETERHECWGFRGWGVSMSSPVFHISAEHLL